MFPKEKSLLINPMDFAMRPLNQGRVARRPTTHMTTIGEDKRASILIKLFTRVIKNKQKLNQI
jgi:hypothetical protein